MGLCPMTIIELDDEKSEKSNFYIFINGKALKCKLYAVLKMFF